jgi:hypothetical protein
VKPLATAASAGDHSKILDACSLIHQLLTCEQIAIESPLRELLTKPRHLREHPKRVFFQNEPSDFFGGAIYVA